MPSSDSRTHYIRLTKAGFETLTVKQAFLDRRPLVKVEATEEDPAVYYSEADGLTFEQAMRLYAPESVALMQEAEGVTPVNLGTLEASETLPEDMTHAFFGLHNLSAVEIAELVRQADQIGAPINSVLIPWGAAKNAYLQDGTLPA